MNKGDWRLVDDQYHEAMLLWWEIDGKDCIISLEPRPHYCDRGNWIAKIEVNDGTPLARDLDGADRWPRYYFDLDRAKLEVEAWLDKRGQRI